MRPEDTREGQAILQEAAYLDSYEGAQAEHHVGRKPCPVCQGDHSDPKDKIIADLLEALTLATEYVRKVHGTLVGAMGHGNLVLPDLERCERAIAAAKVGQ